MTRYSAGYKGPMLPAAGPRPALNPGGGMPGGVKPAPTRPRPMSTGPSLSPRGAMTGGGRPAPTRPMPSMGYKKGGSVGSASKRADGCCVKGKTRGKMI